MIDSDFEGNRIGALIYPMVNNNLNRGVLRQIEGSYIMVKTINLNDDWQNIENDMIKFIHKIEKGFSNA